MKKSIFGRIAFIALALTLVTTCLMSGTLARYTTTVTGDATGTAAAWSFKANGQTATMTTINLRDTVARSTVTTNEIAPGSEGSFDIVIDANGSDVSVDYTIAFSNLLNKPTNLKFYSDAAHTDEIANLVGYTGLNGTIALGSVGTPVTKTVYWQWAYQTDGGDAQDTADQGKVPTFDINVVGTQVD